MTILRVPGIEVVRNGRTIPLLPTPAVLSSRVVQWDGMALEVLHISPGVIPDHEHATHAVHLITNAPVRASLIASDGIHSGSLEPRTIMLMPRGSRHRFLAEDPIATVSVALHPELLSRALCETTPGAAIELTPQRNLVDPHVTSVLLALRADLEDGSPAGRLYGETLGTALAVYLARRYGAPPMRTRPVRHGLPTYRLRQVLDYITAHLDQDLSLADLARTAGMSPHHFAVLFRQRMGTSPHRHVVEQRIERAKHLLRDHTRSILDVALASGFESQSHFGRVFRRVVGVTPSDYRAAL
jgi:AraC family transcriptional regulator